MTFPFSKTFAIGAIAASSTLAMMAVAQPTYALTVTRTENAPPVVNTGDETVSLDFSTNVNANNFPITLGPSENPVTISTVAGGPPGLGPRINGGVLELRGNDTPSATFQFSDYLAYFSVQFLSFGTSTNPVIQFFRDNNANPVASFTSAQLLGLTGSGNYFNFSENVVSSRFNRVVIAGTNVTIDNVAYRVPTPALLPGLVGMGVAALRKRKAEAEQGA